MDAMGTEKTLEIFVKSCCHDILIHWVEPTLQKNLKFVAGKNGFATYMKITPSLQFKGTQ